MRDGVDGVERLVLRLAPSGDELVIEWAGDEPDPSRQESLAPGVTLERRAEGRPLRLRLAGLARPCETNAHVSPAIRCGPDGCGEIVAPDGSRLYWLGLSPHAARRPVYSPASFTNPANRPGP